MEDLDARLEAALTQGFDRIPGLKWDPTWHPRKRWVARRRRRMLWMGSMAAGLMLMAIPLRILLHPSTGTGSAPQVLAGAQLSPSVKAVADSLNGKHLSIASPGLLAQYRNYPELAPDGTTLVLNGKFSWGSHRGSQLVLSLSTPNRTVRSGILFDAGVPVWAFQGSNPQQGQAIAPAPQATPETGRWVQGGPTGLTSFAAAGSMIYLTHGADWTAMSTTAGAREAFWNPPPDHATTSQDAVIAALPSSPNLALLVEQQPDGNALGWVSTNAGKHWTPWILPREPVSQPVAIGHHFWAIVDGSLMSSTDGAHWTNVLPLDDNHWSVSSYAVDPSQPKRVVVSLQPTVPYTVGPMLETTDGGKHWTALPNFPVLGKPVSSLVVSPQGDVTALVNLTHPVLVQLPANGSQWHILPVPTENLSPGTGTLTANASGDLLYGDPNGRIYQWNRTQHTWAVISPPVPESQAPSPLTAVGTQQVLAAYTRGWYIFVNAPPSTPSPSPSTSPSP